jgi:type IV pilus assembly protein PilV
MDMKLIRSHNRGFTLVEMLVALVVLSVGMLGIAGLFTVSLRSGGSAIQRMQAVNLAADMADRIRANRRAAANYGATAAATGTDKSCVGPSAVVCNPADMAATDIFVWKNAITAAFKGGTATGEVVYTPASLPTLPATYLITVAWKEQAQASTDTASSSQSVQMRIQLPTN